MLLADNLNQLLEIVPDFIRRPLESHPKREILIEIVLDIGRRPEARSTHRGRSAHPRSVQNPPAISAAARQGGASKPSTESSDCSREKSRNIFTSMSGNLAASSSIESAQLAQHIANAVREELRSPHPARRSGSSA